MSHTPTPLRTVLVRTFGLSPQDAAFWDEATDYEAHDPDFKATLVERLQDIRPWLERFGPGTAHDWFKVGMEPDEAMAFHRKGYTAQQAYDLVDLTLRAFFANPSGQVPFDSQHRWLRSRLSPDEVLERVRRGESAP